jgi:hypothetical protein
MSKNTSNKNEEKLRIYLANQKKLAGKKKSEKKPDPNISVKIENSEK